MGCPRPADLGLQVEMLASRLKKQLRLNNTMRGGDQTGSGYRPVPMVPMRTASRWLAEQRLW